MSSLALAPSITRPIRLRRRVVAEVALVLGGTLLVACLAQVSLPLPGTPVPLTGQTLGALLVGASLGSGRALASMSTYLALGAVGLPVFAGHASGIDVLRLSSATGGYLVGMVLAAGLVGAFADRGLDRRVRSVIPAMVLGSVVIYACGAAWLANATGVDLPTALRLGVRPFLVGDALKTGFAILALPTAWRMTRSVRGRWGDE
jgi:biotin transport system substrate-specific component